MDTEHDSDSEARARLVLFADISGSTRLFEAFGDEKARDACAACLEMLAHVVEAHHGRVVKTIGDEIMAVFEDPSSGVMAGTDMQGVVRRANAEGRFETGEMRIKVGMHFGAAEEEMDDLLGEAPAVARQLTRLAKPDQVLTSDATMETVPRLMRTFSRLQDRVASVSGGAMMNVHELMWELSGVTEMATGALPERRAEQTRLLLTYQGVSYTCNADEPVLTIGRVAGNHLVVATELTSRLHAEIEYRRGRFHISDNSVNGTLVIPRTGAAVSLRREAVALRGRGQLCMGGTPQTNPEGVIDYVCE